MRVTIDRSRCVGAGNCVVSAQNVFSQNDDDGLVVVLLESPGGADAEKAREAAELCPNRVITIVE